MCARCPTICKLDHQAYNLAHSLPSAGPVSYTPDEQYTLRKIPGKDRISQGGCQVVYCPGGKRFRQLGLERIAFGFLEATTELQLIYAGYVVYLETFATCLRGPPV